LQVLARPPKSLLIILLLQAVAVVAKITPAVVALAVCVAQLPQQAAAAV